jgi:cytidylate kinase
MVRLNGADVTEAIRAPQVTSASSQTAAFGGVRLAMVAKQREMARSASVVMEGRDIGTVVFPDADVKIYLDAGEQERVRRRLAETSASEPRPGEAGQLAAAIRERDTRDRERAEAPLMQAPDALYLDSTGLSIEQVEEAILKIVRERISNGKGLS